MSKVRTAVIPVAGYGTRFLPFTKAVPKAMLPVVNQPAIELIVKEASQSGIQRVILVVGQNKEIIESHFSSAKELESVLEKRGSLNYLESIKNTCSGVEVICVIQPEQTGTASAVLCAKDYISNNEPFAVMFGDDLMSSEVPVLKQLINLYEQTEKTVIGVKNVGYDQVGKYASVEYDKREGDIYHVCNLTEKPKSGQAKSDLAPLGRYVFGKGTLEVLQNLKAGLHGEYQITDAICEQAKAKKVLALAFEGTRYDMGDRLGFLKANVEEGLRNPEIKEDFKKYLENLVKNF